MKKLTFILAFFFVALTSFGQKSIDRLFEKYSGDNGFVTLTLSGNFLNIFKNTDKKNDDHWPENVTEIRILVQDDDSRITENFYDLAKKELDTRDYEEYMSVKKYNQDIRMIIKADPKMIHEFLLIGGGEDNFIIQVKGNITYKEAEDLSSDLKRNHNHSFISDLN